MSAPLIVAHLVRREEGLPAFARFLASYRRHPAGCPHSLALLTKGFTGPDWAPYQELLADLPCQRHAVPTDGFDLGAYRAFLPAASGHAVLFLNSHAEMLVDGWLDLLARHSGPGRLVGASASWNSHRRDLATDVPPWVRPGGRLRSRLYRACRAFRESWRSTESYQPFPNPHVRTNAFLLPPELHPLVAAWPHPQDKATCYALESGDAGLSCAMVRAGGALIMAGSDGRAYAPLAWPEARIFCSDRQQNLIIGDNHTRDYAEGSHDRRRLVGWCTWRSFHIMAPT